MVAMNSTIELLETSIEGVLIFRRRIHHDARGSFEKLFESSDLPRSIGFQINQVNLSRNLKKGTVRGLHYQNHPFAESKIVQVIRGRIMDFVVDIRKDSHTFLKKLSVELSSDDGSVIIIPSGVAHGFQTLEDCSDIVYLHSQPYHSELQCGLNILDPALELDLPLEVTEISPRDKSYSLITKCFSGI